MGARAFVLLLAGLLVAATSEAAVLCAHPRRDSTLDTSVRVREVCKPAEVQLGIVTLAPLVVLDQARITTTSTSTTSSTTIPTTAGHCSFTGRSCTADADCTLAGLCNEWGGCTQTCGGSTPACPTTTFCFPAGGQGNVCAGCGGSSSRCTVNEICSVDTCTECCAATSAIAAQYCPPDPARCHPECNLIGKPCVISDPCVQP